MALKTSVVCDFDEFLKLREPWNELVRQTEVDHAFMRHEWFECWINNIGRKDNIAILTAWADGQLAAVAPMKRERHSVKGIPARALSFLASAISPRCNFIMHDNVPKGEFFNKLFEIGGVDLIITRGLDTKLTVTGAYLNYLAETIPGRYDTEEGRQSPFLMTESNWEDYSRNIIPKEHRRNLTKRLNRLAEAKSHEVIKITDYDGLSGIFEQLVEVSAKSWKAQVGSDLKSNTKHRAFLQEFSRKGSDQQLFELWVLKINGAIAAFEYYLKGHNRLSAIRSDFDLEYDRFSPGNLLRMFALQDVYARDGAWEYDMGGMAYDYKMQWTNALRQHVAVTVSSGSLLGNLLMFGKTRLLPLLRKKKQA